MSKWCHYAIRGRLMLAMFATGSFLAVWVPLSRSLELGTWGALKQAGGEVPMSIADKGNQL